MKEQDMPNQITPFANESYVFRIGDLEIENRLDRVSISEYLVITKDQAGLGLAQELHVLVGRVIKALEAEKQLPQTVELVTGVVVGDKVGTGAVLLWAIQQTVRSIWGLKMKRKMVIKSQGF
jgi:hypothetical protein